MRGPDSIRLVGNLDDDAGRDVHLRCGPARRRGAALHGWAENVSNVPGAGHRHIRRHRRGAVVQRERLLGGRDEPHGDRRREHDCQPGHGQVHRLHLTFRCDRPLRRRGILFTEFHRVRRRRAHRLPLALRHRDRRRERLARPQRRGRFRDRRQALQWHGGHGQEHAPERGHRQPGLGLHGTHQLG